jgi:hypothetical protein
MQRLLLIVAVRTSAGDHYRPYGGMFLSYWYRSLARICDSTCDGNSGLRLRGIRLLLPCYGSCFRLARYNYILSFLYPATQLIRTIMF